MQSQEIKNEKKQHKKKSVIDFRNVLCYFKCFHKRIPKIVAGIVQSFRFNQLNLQGRVGMRDPADTGMIFGTVQSLQYLFSNKVHIDVIPDFYQRRLEYFLSFQLQCVLFVLLWRLFLTVVNMGWIYLRCKLNP